MDQKTFTNLVQTWQAAEVRAALAAKPSFASIVAPNGMTPLHRCCRANLKQSGLPAKASIATAKALIDAGADVNNVRIIMDEGEEFRATPLWFAVAWGQNPALARFLLESGANPNDCLYASAWAQDAKLTEMLLEYGAVADPVAGGETPLMFILKARRGAAAAVLIKHGADINFRDAQGFTVLHHAVKKKFTQKQVGELVKLGADPSVKNHDGETPSELAKRLGQTGLTKFLAAETRP
jgi:ankyrin repeat protein